MSDWTVGTLALFFVIAIIAVAILWFGLQFIGGLLMFNPIAGVIFAGIAFGIVVLVCGALGN